MEHCAKCCGKARDRHVNFPSSETLPFYKGSNLGSWVCPLDSPCSPINHLGNTCNVCETVAEGAKLT